MYAPGLPVSIMAGKPNNSFKPNRFARRLNSGDGSLMRTFLAFLFLLIFVAPVSAGTWGVGHFDNDQSLDTASDWAESGTVDVVRKALDLAISAKYLESSDAEDALVAAEVVAAALGKPNKDLPTDLAAWIQRQSPDQLRALAPQALAAIARVRSPEGSELYALWADQGVDEWLTQVDALVSRLGSADDRPEP